MTEIMDDKILVSNIQRFSLHDGPGIRSTVFLMGCSLRCPWCSNPENLKCEVQGYFRDGRHGQYGKYMTTEDIFAEVMKDKAYYGTGSTDEDELSRMPGGITFSGGEPLLQAERLVPLWDKLKKEQVHIAVESALFVPKERLEQAIRYADLFYIDVKILKESICKNLLGGGITLYQQNVQALFESKKKVVFRIPVIGGYTDTEENRKDVIRFLSVYKPLKVELIKGHDLGRSKYMSLGMEPPRFEEPNDRFIEEYCEQICDIGIKAEICKI